MGDAAHPSGEPRPAIDYLEVEDSARFRELKREHRSFVFPLAVAFLVWYFAFVLLSDYAHELMSTPVIGNVNLGILLGLGQFVTCDELRWEFGDHHSVQTVGTKNELARPGTPAYRKWHDAVLKYRDGVPPKHGAIWPATAARSRRRRHTTHTAAADESATRTNRSPGTTSAHAAAARATARSATSGSGPPSSTAAG